MSYTKITDFAAKDSLLSGNPAKAVKGTEIGAEFDAIAVADALNVKTSALGANVATFLATPSSANLRGALTDETGTGAAVFADTPTLVTPILGTPTSGTLTNCTATTQSAGNNSTSIATTAYVDRLTNRLNPITASVAANAMTLTINPQVIDFRSSTLGSGTINSRTVSAAISTVISSGSTAGSVSGQPSRIAVLAIDNAGTVEVAWCNATGANNLDEGTLISTTAEGGAGAADSGNVIYSTTARSSVPFRIVGYVDSTQTTAGTWATAPSTIQGAGGLTSGNRPTQLFQQPAQATTSGTAINFTGVPAWVKRITLSFSGVSTNGTTGWYVQIGSGSYDTSGYLGGSLNSTTSAVETQGFAGGQAASAAAVHHGAMTLTLLNPATNIWAATCTLFRTDSAQNCMSGGTRTLTGTLTQFRMVTTNGTDTFDAGSVGVLWE